MLTSVKLSMAMWSSSSSDRSSQKPCIILFCTGSVDSSIRHREQARCLAIAGRACDGKDSVRFRFRPVRRRV